MTSKSIKADESRGRAPGQASDHALRAPNPLDSSTMTRVVYYVHQKPIWFQTVQMERKNFDWKIPFGARAFHFP